MAEIHCDIVLPVYNSLSFVKDCLDSVVAYTTGCPYTLYIMDDGSDGFVREYLAEFSKARDNVKVHLNSENLGFVKNCNKGMGLGSSKYVVLLNTDVVVTPGWLSRLVECAESDEAIASVNPFTNYAAVIDMQMPPGSNFFAVDEFLSKNSAKKPIDVVTGVGFCMLLRRSALEEVGYFDEIYGMGYCEESDLCMRFTTNGYRTVVADDVYVYHKGQTTFLDGDERYRKNRAIFDSRWEDEYLSQYRLFDRTNALKKYRDAMRPYYLPVSMLSLYRKALKRLRSRLSRTRLKKVVRLLRGVMSKPDLLASAPPMNEANVVGLVDDFRISDKNSTAITARYGKGFSVLSSSGRPSVTFVLNDLSVCGGVISVVQTANELIRTGIDARIVALKSYGIAPNWKSYSSPLIFNSTEEMRTYFPPSDLIVATLWITAYWADYFVKTMPGTVPAYYIQDYESWFYPEEDARLRGMVKDSYNLIPNRIVTSDWLKGMIGDDGFDSYKIPLGLDLGIYYPRDPGKGRRHVALAMARPSTPRRGFENVVEAMRLLRQKVPGLEVVFFGEDLSGYDIGYEYNNMGRIFRQDQLARLYSDASVFLDGSDFQGFGFPALEAMACGTPCVLTDNGGVNEYARDGVNCLTIPPKNPEAAAEAMAKVLKDRNLSDHLTSNGLETVKAYCHRKQTNSMKEYFLGLIG